jgi:hypothetical protein
MRITERRLRRIIRNVIKESANQQIDLSPLLGLIDAGAIEDAEDIANKIINPFEENLTEIFSKNDLKKAIGPLIISVVMIGVVLAGGVQGQKDFKQDVNNFDAAQRAAVETIKSMESGPYKLVSPQEAQRIFDELEPQQQDLVKQTVSVCMDNQQSFPGWHPKAMKPHSFPGGRVNVPGTHHRLTREECNDFYRTFFDPGSPDRVNTDDSEAYDWDTLPRFK